MPTLRVIVFDVQHGFCAFLKSPTGHTLLIDCGRGELFSPVGYIVENELSETVTYDGYKLTRLIVSHPHDDHIEDIETVIEKFKPAMLSRQEYDWEDIKEPSAEEEYENLNIYSDWQETYNQPVTQPPDWGVDIEQFFLTPGLAKQIDEDKYVNNSSIVVVVTFNGTRFSEKFLFGADMEQAGWEELLKRDLFTKAVEGVDFYVTSHHGHTSGFSTLLYNAMGRPIVNIVSAHRRDESVDTRYSSEEYTQGTQLNGETRRMLSTRKDGSIFIDVNEEGKFLLRMYKLQANLKKQFASW